MPLLQDDAPAVLPSRRQRMTAPALTLGGLALATVALRLRDPHANGSWGHCPSAAVGIWCPGCGGLRATNDLTHGDLAAAASSNLLLVLAIPVVVLLLARWAVGAWRGTLRPLPPAAVSALGWVYGVLAVVFTLARNTPAGAWLAP